MPLTFGKPQLDQRAPFTHGSGVITPFKRFHPGPANQRPVPSRARLGPAKQRSRTSVAGNSACRRRDPPPLKWSILMLCDEHIGGPSCQRSDTKQKRSSPSFARSTCIFRGAAALPMPSDKTTSATSHTAADVNNADPTPLRCIRAYFVSDILSFYDVSGRIPCSRKVGVGRSGRIFGQTSAAFGGGYRLFPHGTA